MDPPTYITASIATIKIRMTVARTAPTTRATMTKVVWSTTASGCGRAGVRDGIILVAVE